MTQTLIALGIGGAVLLLDKHLPMLVGARRPRPARGLIERLFASRWKTDPPS